MFFKIHIGSLNDEMAILNINSSREEYLISKKKNVIKEVEWIFSKVNVIVIGPGLSREKNMQSLASEIIKRALLSNAIVIVDGDGLSAIFDVINTLESDILSKKKTELYGKLNYNRLLVTPNVREFKRLYKKVFNQEVCH